MSGTNSVPRNASRCFKYFVAAGDSIIRGMETSKRWAPRR